LALAMRCNHLDVPLGKILEPFTHILDTETPASCRGQK
jgi:hypothetical protein